MRLSVPVQIRLTESIFYWSLLLGLPHPDPNPFTAVCAIVPRKTKALTRMANYAVPIKHQICRNRKDFRCVAKSSQEKRSELLRPPTSDRRIKNPPVRPILHFRVSQRLERDLHEPTSKNLSGSGRKKRGFHASA